MTGSRQIITGVEPTVVEHGYSFLVTVYQRRKETISSHTFGVDRCLEDCI